LLAAALFGMSAPLAKRLLGDTTPQILAGLLYLGSGIGLSIWKAARGVTAEQPLSRSDAPTLLGLVVAGGVLRPLLMLLGLDRVSATTGSLLLNLEGPFTIALAVLLFGEHLGRYGIISVVCIVAGASVLRFQSGDGRTDALGMICIALACAAWALDNNLTQRLSLRDPLAVVRIKALAAGSFNLLLGLVLGGKLPDLRTVGAALLLGLLSYGASVVLDAYALRLVGAAREAAYFATAPFVGALVAVLLLHEPLSALDVLAMGLMALGVVALLRERHSHVHVHDALVHAQLHVHDQHHQHEHSANDPAGEPHSHEHPHVHLVHDHPHVPDAHHRHRH
jgi:drug/metabolite transporter (DMT)-like permease